MARAGVTSFLSLPTLLESIADTELERAREDTQTLLEDGAIIVQVIESVFGRDAFGVGMIRAVAREAQRKPALLALALIMLAAMRRDWTDEENENFDGILRALRDAAPGARRYLKTNKAVKRKLPPRPRERSGGATHGKEPSACPPSVAPP
jgi:hypothetical protein